MFTGKFLKGWAVGASVAITLMCSGTSSALTLMEAVATDFSGTEDVIFFNTVSSGVTYNFEPGATFIEAGGDFLVVDGFQTLGTFFNSTPLLVVTFDSPVNIAGFSWINGAMALGITAFENQNGTGATDTISINTVASNQLSPSFVALKSTDGMNFQRLEIQLGDTGGTAFIDDFRFEEVDTGPTTDPVIPEPTTAVLGLVGLGALGLLVIRSRKHSRHAA